MARRAVSPASGSSSPPGYPSSLRSKASQYTLRTIPIDVDSDSVLSDAPIHGERPPSPSEHSRLFGPLSIGRSVRRYGASAAIFSSSRASGVNVGDFVEQGDVTTTGGNGPRRWLNQRPLLKAGLQMAGIFVLSTLLLGGTLWLALPTLDEEDRPRLRLPKSFAQLQDLNMLLKKYKTIYPFRTVICFVITYLFLQAFSLPGSMYLSILGGAVWGMAIALPLCCACVATGATLCYAISAAFGPALLAMPKWKERVDKWALKVEAQRANLLSFMIVLRIAPFPPHWVVNVVCPHLGIGVLPFWVSTFLGIMGVTVIHTTIGGGLDEMTSAKDFKLISWKNALGLSAIVVAVLIPVGLRYYWRNELESVAEAERQAAAEESQVALEGVVVESGPLSAAQKGKAVAVAASVPTGTLVLLDDDDDEFDDDLLEAIEADEMPSSARKG